MGARILASLAFLAGGVLLWFILGALHALGASQAGMSAVSVPELPSADAMIPWFVCLFFAISSIGVPFAKSRRTLMTVAMFAYLMLLIAFVLLCSEGFGGGVGKFIGGVITLGLLVLFALSPWHIIWWLLYSRSPEIEPKIPAEQNAGPDEQKDPPAG